MVNIISANTPITITSPFIDNNIHYTVVGVDGLAEEFSEVVPNTYVIGSINKSNPTQWKLTLN